MYALAAFHPSLATSTCCHGCVAASCRCPLKPELTCVLHFAGLFVRRFRGTTGDHGRRSAGHFTDHGHQPLHGARPCACMPSVDCASASAVFTSASRSRIVASRCTAVVQAAARRWPEPSHHHFAPRPAGHRPRRMHRQLPRSVRSSLRPFLRASCSSSCASCVLLAHAIFGHRFSPQPVLCLLLLAPVSAQRRT